MSGKKGRPTADRLARQHEIYVAVSPLLLAVGPTRLTMRDAAEAAFMSLGGLCHYFPTKRELVLHGLQPAALTRICRIFGDLLDGNPAWPPEKCLNAYLDHAVYLLTFARPAIRAALERGTENLESHVHAVMSADIGEYVFRRMLPDLPDSELHLLGRALRRVGLGAALDPSTSPGEIKGQLRAVIHGYIEKTV